MYTYNYGNQHYWGDLITATMVVFSQIDRKGVVEVEGHASWVARVTRPIL